MAVNKSQLHGLFYNNELIWWYPSRSQAMIVFEIPRNGPGTKASVQVLKQTGFLRYKDGSYCIKPITLQESMACNVDRSRDQEVEDIVRSNRRFDLNLQATTQICNECGFRKPWNETFFSPLDESGSFRTTCRECRRASAKKRYASFAERVRTLKDAGHTTFYCPSCDENCSFDIVSCDRFICRPCIQRMKLVLHEEDVPDGAAPGTDCTSCGVEFDRDLFQWRKDTGTWRKECKHCHGYPYVCRLCGMFKVSEPDGLCYVDRLTKGRTKVHEDRITDLLAKEGLIWTTRDQALPCATKQAYVRPDLVFTLNGYIIILEIDENYHRYYNVDCEMKRVEILHEQCQTPLILIRYNPHSDQDQLLLETLRSAINFPNIALEEIGVFIYYIGYRHSRVQTLNEYTSTSAGFTFPFQSIGEL